MKLGNIQIRIKHLRLNSGCGERLTLGETAILNANEKDHIIMY